MRPEGRLRDFPVSARVVLGGRSGVGARRVQEGQVNGDGSGVFRIGRGGRLDAGERARWRDGESQVLQEGSRDRPACLGGQRAHSLHRQEPQAGCLGRIGRELRVSRQDEAFNPRSPEILDSSDVLEASVDPAAPPRLRSAQVSSESATSRAGLDLTYPIMVSRSRMRAWKSSKSVLWRYPTAAGQRTSPSTPRPRGSIRRAPDGNTARYHAGRVHPPRALIRLEAVHSTVLASAPPSRTSTLA